MNMPTRPIARLIEIGLLLAVCSAPMLAKVPAAVEAEAGQGVREWRTAAAPNAPLVADASPADPAAGSPATLASAIPLKDALGSLEPQDVWQNFYDITQIPRPSGHLDGIREFLVGFGETLGLETHVDQAGNVIIRKPAAPGLEDRPGVVLQAHMDMVPQKGDGVVFDFATDPIGALVDGDYVVTDGTTLGADNGIGIAMIMAVLQATELQTGPLEALFTADEETTMSGANGLKADVLKGRILINLDSEEEGTFTIGSAGGGHVDVNGAYPQAPAPADWMSYEVKVKGLKGGHSGVDINLGRGHATKLLVRLLKASVEPYGLKIASISGGTAPNAIPRDASALLFIQSVQVEAFSQYVSGFEATVKAELVAVEPDLSVQVTVIEPPARVMDGAFQSVLINALEVTPQGVIRLSDAVPGLVETSTNLGVVSALDGQLEVVNYPRSSVDSELEDISQMVASVWELAGYPAEASGFYAGWAPNPDSPILGLTRVAYADLFGLEPDITAVHAGLECGAIGAIYPGMDMISMGPTINDVHSTRERLHIPSVDRAMRLLYAVLQRVPEVTRDRQFRRHRCIVAQRSTGLACRVNKGYGRTRSRARLLPARKAFKFG